MVGDKLIYLIGVAAAAAAAASPAVMSEKAAAQSVRLMVVGGALIATGIKWTSSRTNNK